MKRMHLVELEDLAWFPTSLRSAGTDVLRFFESKARPYDRIVPHLLEALRASGQTRLIDLGSGSGGALPRLQPLLHAEGVDTQILLTDRYPDPKIVESFNGAHGSRLRYFDQPVDATDVPEDLDGFRTMFTVFHHFVPADAQAILRDAVLKRQPVGVFELTERKPMPVLASFTNLLLTIFAAPLIRPFRLSRLLWTLSLALPLYVWWDGMVSCLRSYTVEELRRMAAGLPDSNYVWSIGTERMMPANVTFMIGYPRPEAGQSSARSSL